MGLRGGQKSLPAPRGAPTGWGLHESGGRGGGPERLCQHHPPRGTQTHPIHLPRLLSDEEALTLPRLWALLQAPGPPCYK